ncbi:hypothetical protein RND71_006256 [Anisodus tanguticus]|uniref:Uncharacterized protein n=1 Tax=Anisodus tanguticus TaxID=243964 RepID=A0AAE1VVK0_9SOLA|nr:hypothetical protein RND71_006256 [Anisodus tanguticus]
MVQKFSIFPLILFIITCGAILVRAEVTKIPRRPYLRSNPGILPQGIAFHKSKGLTENHVEDDIGESTSRGLLPRGVIIFHKAISPKLSENHGEHTVSSKISNTNFENLKKSSIFLKRLYLSDNPAGLLPRGVTFHKAISPRLSVNHDEHANSPAVRKS